MFSLRAPTQPAKPRINVIPPTTRTSQTGSKPCSWVTWVKSNKTPYTHMWKSQQHVVIEPTAMVTSSERSSLTFSLQAQNPAAMKAAPASCNTRNTIKSGPQCRPTNPERLPLPAFWSLPQEHSWHHFLSAEKQETLFPVAKNIICHIHTQATKNHFTNTLSSCS